MYLRTGDATSYRAALDLLPSSIKDHGLVASNRFWFALYARDWAAAKRKDEWRKQAAGVSLVPTKNAEEDEEDWDMTLNRYKTLC